MEACSDEAVDVMAVIEACEQEVQQISEECGATVAAQYDLGLQSAYECLLGMEYCGTEEDVEAQPDAMETCSQLFEEQNSELQECRPEGGVDQSVPDMPSSHPIDYEDPFNLRYTFELGDDDSTTLEVPFALSFFGMEYTSITIASNGLILLGEVQSDGCCYGLELPQYDEYNGLIALGWGDLVPDETRKVRWQIKGEAPTRELWIQFDSVPAITDMDEHVSSRMRWVEGKQYVDIFLDSILYSEAMTVGVESQDGALASVLPEYNAGPIQAERVAHRYSVGVPE